MYIFCDWGKNTYCLWYPGISFTRSAYGCTYDIFMQKQTLGNNENVDLELIRKGNTIYKAIDDIQNYLDKDDCYERIIIQTF